MRSEPEEPLISDEDAPTPTWSSLGSGSDESVLRSTGLQLAGMPGGTLVGTVVHGALERLDFDASDLMTAVADAVRQELEWCNLELGDVGAVVAGLSAAVASPLGPLAGDIALRDIPRAKRVDELGFELPLVGGDTPCGALDVGDVADVLQAHLLPGDPMFDYRDVSATRHSTG